MNPAFDSLMYFAVLGLLCGVVSFRLGWRIGGRVALPLTQTLLGFLAFAASWRSGGAIAAAIAAGGWVAGTTVVAIPAFMRDDARVAGAVVGVLRRRRSILQWLAGSGSRSGPWDIVSRMVGLLAPFLMASTLSAGALAIGIGALLLNAMNANVAALVTAARQPWVARGLAWNPWSVARVIAFAALGSACAAPMAALLGYPADAANIRRLLIAGALAALADVVLEWTLSPAYRRRLAAMVDLESPQDQPDGVPLADRSASR